MVGARPDARLHLVRPAQPHLRATIAHDQRQLPGSSTSAASTATDSTRHLSWNPRCHQAIPLWLGAPNGTFTHCSAPGRPGARLVPMIANADNDDASRRAAGTSATDRSPTRLGWSGRDYAPQALTVNGELRRFFGSSTAATPDLADVLWSAKAHRRRHPTFWAANGRLVNAGGNAYPHINPTRSSRSSGELQPATRCPVRRPQRDDILSANDASPDDRPIMMVVVQTSTAPRNTRRRTASAPRSVTPSGRGVPATALRPQVTRRVARSEPSVRRDSRAIARIAASGTAAHRRGMAGQRAGLLVEPGETRHTSFAMADAAMICRTDQEGRPRRRPARSSLSEPHRRSRASRRSPPSRRARSRPTICVGHRPSAANTSTPTSA